MPRRAAGGGEAVPWKLDLVRPADEDHAALPPTTVREMAKAKLHVARMADATPESKAQGFDVDARDRTGARVVKHTFPDASHAVTIARRTPRQLYL